MKMSKMKVLTMIVALLMLVLVGCSTDEVTETGASTEVETEAKTEANTEETTSEALVEESKDLLSYDGTLRIFNEDTEFEIAYNDIYSMEAVQADVKHISSSGEESNNMVEGVTLESILSKYSLSKQEYTGIRFTAGDGYAITVPGDVFMDKDVILAYKFDGELLEDKKMPLRVAINDVRSMYYVANVVSVELLKVETDETSEAVDTGSMVMLETVTATLENEDFMYYDSNDKAVKMTEILTMVPATGSHVEFVASDGYAKEESIEVVTEGYIKTTGEDAPLFTGLDLPIGMNVKYVLTMVIGDTSFVSVASAMEANGLMAVGDYEGVKLSEAIMMAGIEGDFYTLTANDGYSVEVTSASTSEAILYVSDEGTVTVRFDAKYPKNTTVKGLLSVTVTDGSKTEMAVEEDKEETVEEDKVVEESVASWVVTVNGLSDGSFDFDSDRAERKLDLVAVHTARSKNDVVTEEDWEGYKVTDVLEFLRVEEFKSLTITAGDGYEIELMKEAIDDETILAVTKNGQALSEADNMVQLVQNTQFATTWIKGVAAITVNN